MKQPSPQAETALAEYESVILEIAGHVLTLQQIARRLPELTDPALIQRDDEWARGVFKLLSNRQLHSAALQLELASFQESMNLDQIQRRQHRNQLLEQLVERANQLEGELAAAVQAHS